MRKNKIMFLDIETLMIPEETLSRIPSYGAYPGRGFNGTVSSILCFGYKFQGDKTVKCVNAWNYPEFKKNPNNDEGVCKEIARLMKDVDVIVTQNGKKFDVPVINTRLAKYGLAPITKSIKHIDTKNVFKANYAAYDNKLDTIAKTFGCETKLENGGWQLWMDMYKNKESSKRLMEKYCKQDVNVLEQVFNKLMPVIKGLPNQNRNIDDESCPKCGSEDLIKDGSKRLSNGIYQLYRCKSCGSKSRAVKPFEKIKPGLVEE